MNSWWGLTQTPALEGCQTWKSIAGLVPLVMLEKNADWVNRCSSKHFPLDLLIYCSGDPCELLRIITISV